MASDFSSHWNTPIIFLSIGIAFIGAYGGIVLCEQFRLCSKENQPKLLNRGALMWLMAMAIGGVAIWTMHFVGMSALSLKDPFGNTSKIQYRIDLTLVSLAVVIIMCYAGIWVSSRDGVYTSDNEDTVEQFIKGAANMSIQELRAMRHKNYVLFITLFKNMKGIALGGVITAAGVCVMHYIGMEAMVVENGKMEWDAGIVAASVLIALVAATAAFWILFRLLALYPYMEIFRIASAAVAAIAVNGMHYTGMAALRVRYVAGHRMALPAGVQLVDQYIAMVGAVVASMIFLWLIVLFVMADLRAWFYNASKTIRFTDQMMEKLKKDTENSVALHGNSLAGVSGNLSPFNLLNEANEHYGAIRRHDFYAERKMSSTTRKRRSDGSHSSRAGGSNSVRVKGNQGGGGTTTGAGNAASLPVFRRGRSDSQSSAHSLHFFQLEQHTFAGAATGTSATSATAGAPGDSSAREKPTGGLPPGGLLPPISPTAASSHVNTLGTAALSSLAASAKDGNSEKPSMGSSLSALIGGNKSSKVYAARDYAAPADANEKYTVNDDEKADVETGGCGGGVGSGAGLVMSGKDLGTAVPDV